MFIFVLILVFVIVLPLYLYVMSKVVGAGLLAGRFAYLSYRKKVRVKEMKDE